MSRRRNSPALQQMSPYMRKLVDEEQHAIPSSGPQVEMPGMETNTSSRVLRRELKNRQIESSKKKAAEDRFEFDCRRFKLTPFVRGFKLLKSVQVPRVDGKNIPSRWFFDFGWQELKLLVEINGGIWMEGGGAHSHPVDIERNMTKQNDAALEGFIVLQFTPQEVKDESAVAFTQRVMYARGWKP